MKMNTILHETCQQYVARRLSEGWRVAGRYKHLVFLSPPDGSFIRPVDLRNDVETLRPNAAGDETECFPSSGANYQCVDDVTPDEDSTYVYGTGITTGYRRDFYNIPDSSIPDGATINFIKVYVRCRRVEETTIGFQAIIKYTNLYYGALHDYTASYQTVSEQWTNNPYTEEPWTRDDIDALQIGVRLGYSANKETRCTQVYVEVDYTLPPTHKDIATRFKLWARSYKDIAARFKLLVRAYQDIAARFRLRVQGFTDIATRFKLVPLAYQGVSTRFYLYQPSWKSLQILKDIEALEAKVAGFKREPKAHFEI